MIKPGVVVGLGIFNGVGVVVSRDWGVVFFFFSSKFHFFRRCGSGPVFLCKEALHVFSRPSMLVGIGHLVLPHAQ